MAALNGYLALGVLSAAGVFTEISGAPGYARQAISLAPASAGSVQNASTVNFPVNSGSARWPAYGAYAVYDVATGGNVLFAWNIYPGSGAIASRSPLPGRNHSIPAGTIKLEFPAVMSEAGSEVVLSKPFLWTPGGLQRFEESPVTPTGSTVSRALGDQFASYQHPGLYNFRPDNLKRWRKALGSVRAGVANAKLACVGDSTTAGLGAGTAGGNAGARQKSYPHFLRTILNGQGIPAQSNSFWGAGGAGQTANNYDSRVSLGSGWVEGFTSISQVLTNSTTTNALAFTPSTTFDTIDIYYVRGSGWATFTVDVDGGAALATVNASGAGALQKATVSCALGMHTINIRRTGTGTSLNIVGVDAYDSTTKAVSVWNMGWASSKISNWVGATQVYSPLNALGFTAPNLSIINLGINDWNSTTIVDAFKADYQTLINQALASGDAVLCIPVPSSFATSSQDRQQLVTNAIYALAAANDLPVIDLTARFGSYDAMNAIGLYYDTVHPIGMGYADIAQIVASALLV